MGNRMDNMTSTERDDVYNYLHSSYYINRAGSADDVRDVLRLLPGGEDSINRLNSSIDDELKSKNRKSVIELLNSKLKKLSK